MLSRVRFILNKLFSLFIILYNQVNARIGSNENYKLPKLTIKNTKDGQREAQQRQARYIRGSRLLCFNKPQLFLVSYCLIIRVADDQESFNINAFF